MNALEMILLYIIAPSVTIGLSVWGGWFFGRKKQRIETIDAATDTFNKIIKQLREQVEAYVGKDDINTERFNKQETQLNTATKKIEELESTIKRLSDEVESLRREKKENALLKKKIDKYTKLLDDNNIEY